MLIYRLNYFLSNSFDFITLNLHSLAILVFNGRKHWLYEKGSEIWRFMSISMLIVADSCFSPMPALSVFLIGQYKPNLEGNMNFLVTNWFFYLIFQNNFLWFIPFIIPSHSCILDNYFSTGILHMQTYHIKKKQNISIASEFA